MPYMTGLAKQKIAELEIEISKNWDKNKVFEESISKRPIDNQFVLYDGPPFATGLPHYGHVLAGTLKDVFPRYHTMLGKRVERKWGWDCHGVPIEHQIQKELSLDDHRQIKEFGIKEFNEACREVVLKYSDEWKRYVKRMGRFVDMENDYKTMDPSFMESIWSVFSKLNDKGLIYEDKRVIAFSPELGTPLSNFEAKQNYLTTEDPSIVMAFALNDEPSTYLLAWTTTPWSVPSNVAIALNLDIKYVKATNTQGQSYIISEASLEKYQEKIPHAENGLTVTKIDPKQILGQSYQPMFDVLSSEESSQSYRIIASSHVKNDEGTGFVHIAPAFGEDDFQLGKQHQLPALDFLDDHGKFNSLPEIEGGRSNPKVNGLVFRDANPVCIQAMEAQGRLIANDTISHEYPHCWRTSKPLIYRAIKSWFVNVTQIKDKIIENNKQIKWYPANVGTGRFHNWLSEARDWCISRDRYWGTPIPIWRNVNDVNDILVISSVDDLKELTGKTDIQDLHRHFIDDLVIEKDGKTYKRIEAVFDCWFESGAMPYAQQHYPFENVTQFEQTFPADFIAEGLDQTRGWFYTLMILSTALFDKPAFKNCVVNGILLGSDNKKMSKSLRNYPLLDEVFEKYGADAIRLVLLGSPATRADSLAVKDDDFKEAVKKVLLPILNIYEFYAEYSNSAKFIPDKNVLLKSVVDPLDQWLLYRTEQFRQKMGEAFDQYDLQEASRQMRAYIDDLSGWFIRHSRHRFEMQAGVALTVNQRQAFNTLHYALETLSLCIAPITPFISDVVYQALHGSHLSAHLQLWPQPMPVAAFEKGHSAMERIREITHLVATIRDRNNLPFKQPLSMIYLDELHQQELQPYATELKKILNVKAITWLSSENQLVETRICLNAKILGSKYRKEFPALLKSVAGGNYRFEGNELIVEGKKLLSSEFSSKSIPSQNTATEKNKDGTWIIVDTQLTPELVEERRVRELLRHIQQFRAKQKFSKGQPCEIYLTGSYVELAAKYKGEIQFKTGSKIVSKIGSNEEFSASCKIVSTYKNAQGEKAEEVAEMRIRALPKLDKVQPVMNQHSTFSMH